MLRKHILPALGVLSASFLTSCAAVSNTNVQSATSVQPWPERPDYQAKGAGQAAVTRYPASAAMWRLAFGRAYRAQDHAAAIRYATKLAAMGSDVSKPVLDYLSKHMEAPAFNALQETAHANAIVAERSAVFATADSPPQLMEALAVLDSRRILVSSVVSGGIYAHDGKSVQKWTAAEPNNDWSHLGIAADTKRNLLWAAVAKVDPSQKTDAHFVGLIGYDLTTGIEKHRLPSTHSENSSPGDLLLMDDGTAYLADSGNGTIYKCAPGCNALSVVVKPGILRSPQGMVPTKTGDALIVSDYSYGLAHINLSNGQVEQIAAPDNVALDGIDGLYVYQNTLIAIQNGQIPARISRFVLSDNARQILCTDILERAHSAWEEPTNGQVIGNQFYYIGNAQWPKFEKGGAVKAGQSLTPTQIRAIELQNLPDSCA